MARYLDLSIEFDDKNGFAIGIREPESGEASIIKNNFSPDEHPVFDAEIGAEIYSWLSLWKEEEEVNIELIENEQELVQNIMELAASVPEGYELEMTHLPGGDDCPAGWYAYKYSKAYGQATPLEDCEEAIITDETAMESYIDVVKCCNVADVYCS